MLTQSESELLTRTGPGTPCGDMMRQYWQPVALSSELPAGGDPVPLTVLGENLVLFRDESGRVGLLELHCSHRGADLSYGRCENGGLRCVYHGWLFDVDGRCLDQPGEPADSTFKDRVQHVSYRCREAGDIIFAYLGTGEPPAFPEHAAFCVPSEQRFASKILQRCNYLQANEGNLDQVHLSILHKMPAPSFNIVADHKKSVQGSTQKFWELLQDAAPRQDVERMPWGFREYVSRKAPEGEYLKVQTFFLPNAAVVVGATAGKDGFQIHFHVPINDVSHWKFILVHKNVGVLDKAAVQRALLGDDDELTPDYVPLRGPENRYRQDRVEMKTFPSAGFGQAFEIHDTWAVEAPGPIQDRTREHLGYADKSVILMRKVMQEAIKQVQDGKPAPPITRDGTSDCLDLISIGDVVPVGTDGPAYLEKKIEEHRRQLETVGAGKS